MLPTGALLSRRRRAYTVPTVALPVRRPLAGALADAVHYAHALRAYSGVFRRIQLWVGNRQSSWQLMSLVVMVGHRDGPNGLLLAAGSRAERRDSRAA